MHAEIVWRELQEMDKDGLVEPSNSGSPITYSSYQKGGKVNENLLQLNSVMRVEAYPTPHVNELTDQLGRAKYMTRGYWQFLVAEKDQYKTAFITPWGLHEFKVMPFGLSGTSIIPKVNAQNSTRITRVFRCLH